MEITGKTRLFELLDTFPELEETVIQAAPAFKNLKNPVLRRTVGKLATVEKVAQIGGLDTLAFVNLLRRQAGQPEIVSRDEEPQPEMPVQSTDVPDWIIGEPQFVVDGTKMLAEGDVPLNKINELYGQLEPDGYILLTTNFEPIPMIDAARKQNRRWYHQLDPNDPSHHLTYFK